MIAFVDHNVKKNFTIGKDRTGRVAQPLGFSVPHKEARVGCESCYSQFYSGFDSAQILKFLRVVGELNAFCETKGEPL